MQHNLYIQYLYSEFYYKMGMVEEGRCHQTKARAIASQIGQKEMGGLQEYILNVQVLDICLKLEDGLHEAVIRAIQQLHVSSSSKIRRRVVNAKIQAHKVSIYL